MWRLFALVFLTAATAHAETYKWVDQNGVVNYSNTPPPAAAKAPQRIAERVSTYEIDPSLRQAIAYTLPTPYELMLQQEWMQRQRLMAERQNVQTIYENPVEPYRAAGYFSYYPVSWVRPAHRRASSSPSPRSSSSSRWR